MLVLRPDCRARVRRCPVIRAKLRCAHATSTPPGPPRHVTAIASSRTIARMAQRSPLRKLQDPTLVRALEDALTAGQPLGPALARLGVHRSTFTREVRRDEAFGQRIEDALRAGRLRSTQGTGARVGVRSGSPTAPEHVALERSAPREDGVVLHDWLPALLVLLAEIGIALAVSTNLAIAGLAALVSIAYLAIVWRLRRAPLPAMRARGRGAIPIVPPASPRVIPSDGMGTSDVSWLRRRIGQAVARQVDSRPPKGRPRA